MTLAALVDAALRETNLEFSAECPALAAYSRAVRDATRHLEDPCERAFLGGLFADRIGTAFIAGYTESIGVLVGAQPSPAALAVTERGGGAPSAMYTTLTWQGDGARIVGEKTFVTLGAEAECIYVVANEGRDAAGRNHLRLVRLRGDATGLSWSAGPVLPIVPEVAHAVLHLDVHVPANDVLEGDAYVRFVKPFRTVEDIFVHAALCGHLLRMTRAFALPHALQAELIGTFAGLHALSHQPPLAHPTHIALGGVLQGFERLLSAHGEALRSVRPDVVARFERDIALRLVGAKARARRLEVAFSG